MGGVFILLLILTVAKGKAPNYFLIAVAPISVVAASWLTRLATFSVKFQRRFMHANNFCWDTIGLFFSFGIYFSRRRNLGICTFYNFVHNHFPADKMAKKTIVSELAVAFGVGFGRDQSIFECPCIAKIVCVPGSKAGFEVI